MLLSPSLLTESELICEGEGMPFLRLKAKLSEVLGVSQIRSISARSFSFPLESASAVMDILIEAFGSVPDVLKEQHAVFEEHEAARDEAMDIIIEKRILPLEGKWSETLDEAQAIAVSAMTVPGLKGLCLFDEQGIGKTATAIAAFDVLKERGQADCLVVVSPVTMKSGWKTEITEKFLPDKYNVIVLEGSAATNRATLIGNPLFDVLVCNFEAVEGLLVALKGILGRRKAVLVVDESFNVKNKDAARSEAVRDLRRSCVRAFVLCGTPAPNSEVDVIHQYDIADDGYTFGGFVVPKDEEDRRERINQRIEERGTTIRRLKEEVLPDLPDKAFHMVQVAMTGKQASIYEEARSKLVLSLKSMDNATFKKSLTTYFQQRNVLLQICACPEALDPSFADASAKMVALDALVRDIVEVKGKKLVIWSFYKASLNSIMKLYAKHKPVLLDGSSSAAERGESVKRFQTDESVRICVANPAAAGAGVTLHAASDAVYISHSNQAAHFLQSLDRIHRRGQMSPTTDYYLFVCKGTIEEGEVQRLREKEVRQNRLLGDRVKWPNSLDDALAELSISHE
ncbi:hypothetical protein BH11PAT2_BH11PAT2_09140 [soil metagenome]